MIRSEIVLTIPGTPAPKGSLRCRRNPAHSLYEDNPKTKPWRAKVVDAAKRVTQHADAQQPIDIEITFTLERPRSHYRTGRNAHLLRDTAPPLPSTQGTGDTDKLERTILDALQDAGVLVNDAQVTDVTARKRYVRLDDENTPLDSPALLSASTRSRRTRERPVPVRRHRRARARTRAGRHDHDWPGRTRPVLPIHTRPTLAGGPPP
jgi:crossover junction endodeoxyribonuclease RusA